MKKIIIIILLILGCCSISYADMYSAGTLFTPTQSNVTYNLTRVLICDNIDVGKWCFNITGGSDAYDYCNISTTPITIHILAGPVITSYEPFYSPSILEPNNYTFNITVFDIDNSTLNYSWKQNGIEVATTQNFTFIGNYTSTGVWNISILVSDGNGTDYHEWALTIIEVDTTRMKLQEEVRTHSLVLNAVMAILILGAIVIPIGLIVMFINGSLDINLGTVVVVSLMGLGIIIMMFYFIKSALINAI